MLIGFDIDGVLADFTRAFRVLANRKHGVPVYSGGRQATWLFDDMTREQVRAIWAEIDGESGFWSGLDPLITRGEIHDLSAAADAGAQFIYVTSRPAYARNETLQWLMVHGLPAGDLHVTEDKPGVLRGVAGLAGFLDDAPHNVNDLHAGGLPVYVRDWPYNRVDVIDGIRRVYSVGEFLGAVLV